MSSVDKLVKLAERFARKISLAQQSAQSGEIENALQKAGLWDKSNEVAPLLNQAGVGDGPVAINFQVDSKLNVTFLVTATPPASATKLAALLKNKYSAAMRAALAGAGLAVTNTVDVKWLTF